MTLSTVSIKMFSQRGLALLGIFLLLAGFGLTYTWAARQNLLTVSAQGSQEFTELFFTDPKSIPVKIKAGEPQTVSFAIINQTKITKTYSYVVTVDEGNGAKQQVVKSVTLAAGEKSVQTINYTVDTAKITALLSILLQNEHQNIQFRVWAS